MAEDDDLTKIECMFNWIMNLIICRHCDLAIPSEYRAVHANRKHRLRCLDELVNTIVANYGPQGVDAYVVPQAI